MSPGQAVAVGVSVTMSPGQAVVVGVSLLVIILAIIAVVTLVWRKQMLRRRDAAPKDRYRRAIQDLRGGGVHPGGQPIKPQSGDF
jgi:membrane protein implicated in regulation of membrane protease activity